MYVSNFLNLFSNKFVDINTFVYNNNLHNFEQESNACGSIAEIISSEYAYYDVVTYCPNDKILYIKGQKEVRPDAVI